MARLRGPRVVTHPFQRRDLIEGSKRCSPILRRFCAVTQGCMREPAERSQPALDRDYDHIVVLGEPRSVVQARAAPDVAPAMDPDLDGQVPFARIGRRVDIEREAVLRADNQPPAQRLRPRRIHS
jgi:hypothetical protein